MNYQKDKWFVSVTRGRIGAAILALMALILDILGYSFGPEDMQTAYDLITAIIAGVAGIFALISKIRESKKIKED